MNILSEQDKTLLADSARRFFAEQMPVSQMRKLRDEKHPHGFDRELWLGMAGMGWPGTLIDEQYGGLDLGHASLGIVVEQSGRTLAASPLISTAVLCASLVQATGNAAQKSAYLPAIVEGEKLFSLAIDENRRHQPNRIATHAIQDGETFVLNGDKTFILDGHVADRMVVVARTSGNNDDPHGLSLFDVNPQANGVRVQRCHMVDGRNAANLTLTNVRCDSTDVLGRLDNAFEPLTRCLDVARVVLSAEMLGAMSEAFERTLAYLRLRTQFDVPIGSFQALKHRAAKMFCEIELTRAAIAEALQALDEDRLPDDVARLASLAKAKASATFELVSNEAVQMHGGIGMTDDEEIGLFLKRARVAQQTFGDFDYHRDRYASICGF